MGETMAKSAIQPSFRCTAPHVLIALADIERVVRTVALDANGFCRKRMMRILVGIRDDDAIPPIYIEKAHPDQRPYTDLHGPLRAEPNYRSLLAFGKSFTPSPNSSMRPPMSSTMRPAVAVILAAQRY
jgi:hypothetical protein